MHFLDCTSPQLARLAPDRVAVLPLGAVEQHGQHLPVSTDTAIVSELARRTEAALPDQVVLLPTLWLGSSHHHLTFAGTLSLSSATYQRVLVEAIESLLSSGFHRIFLLNGHGGNQTPFASALYELALAHRAASPLPWIAAESYWRLAAPALAVQKFMETPALTHACEYETSLMRALREDLVRPELAKGTRVDRGSKFYDPLGYRLSQVTICETFEQMTPHGAMGDPSLATAEKGRKLFDVITAEIVAFVKEFGTWPLRMPPARSGPSA